VGYFIFILGGFLGIAGMTAHWIEYRVCLRIVKITKDMPDGLKSVEIWLNVMQFRKWKKLKRFAYSNENPTLQKMAKKALRLERLCFGLLLPGMILMVLGATYISK
jgi:hypothetical protein